VHKLSSNHEGVSSETTPRKIEVLTQKKQKIPAEGEFYQKKRGLNLHKTQRQIPDKVSRKGQLFLKNKAQPLD